MQQSLHPKVFSHSAVYLDSESESCWVEWIFSVQLPVHCQGTADVVQGKNAVSVPWMDGWRQREIRKSERQTKLALWIIQHNPWDAERRLWKGMWWMSYVHVSISCNMDIAFAVLSFVSLPALGCPPLQTCPHAAFPASLCFICHCWTPLPHFFFSFPILFSSVMDVHHV